MFARKGSLDKWLFPLAMSLWLVWLLWGDLWPSRYQIVLIVVVLALAAASVAVTLFRELCGTHGGRARRKNGVE